MSKCTGQPSNSLKRNRAEYDLTTQDETEIRVLDSDFFIFFRKKSAVF